MKSENRQLESKQKISSIIPIFMRGVSKIQLVVYRRAAKIQRIVFCFCFFTFLCFNWNIAW